MSRASRMATGGSARRFHPHPSLAPPAASAPELAISDTTALIPIAPACVALAATIPRAVKFEEANARRLTSFEHAPRSPGALAYKALTTEVMSRGQRRGGERDDAPRGHLRGDGAGSDAA